MIEGSEGNLTATGCCRGSTSVRFEGGSGGSEPVVSVEARVRCQLRRQRCQEQE